MALHTGTYGFRFTEDRDLHLCSLFAVGHEIVDTTAYVWDGETRGDGPLLLFQYTVAGEGRYEADGTVHHIGPERAFLTEIPGRHRYYYPADAREPWEFYYLLIRPDLIAPHWTRFKDQAGTAPLLLPDSAPVRLLKLIYAEAHAGRITDPLLASSYVYQFATELARMKAAGQRDRSEWPERITMAAEYIERNYSGMISIDQLSDYVGLSKYHLIRTFSACTGLTPVSYLNRVRTERAMELLRGTGMSVEAVARELGYSSGSYFIKAFRSLTGLTPGEFRGGNESLVYRRLFFD
ncbi:helix-turn-helix transcriptional regulator [Paenibacillus sp. HN-1]|uniref:helix-turn-helix transcriptional regulator n=1 Tax=Paenibacillus TaxID=44249 RepID=UPI001CA7EE85|nr:MULTISPECIES: AraC family transcriptional regulator [Paenibacillus]MBY9077418.1 helix-turn-helix transcriptional regulator [Paenibacillus sp. CGMCC 1.18879]MBY9087473.1 helix-turn-helix transcriptional regulator [Paenibacillus sinensis]